MTKQELSDMIFYIVNSSDYFRDSFPSEVARRVMELLEDNGFLDE